MELASMLAGDEFSDHPESVSPVIGAFLRAYNDWIDDDRRQNLYGYASKVVDSFGSDAVESARADRMTVWAEQIRKRSWPQSLLPAWLQALSRERRPPHDLLGAYAVRSISAPTDESHGAALALIDELLAIGGGDETSGIPATPRVGLLTNL
jgi:hypothetical protein